MKLDKSVAAVVTGGASGLGAATARALAAKGVKVALFDLNSELGEAVAKEIGGVYCEVNVANEESVVAGFASARGSRAGARPCELCRRRRRRQQDRKPFEGRWFDQGISAG
jgi:NAD(P)-dependent dehydrogenase (short-subunit alcohol dehydrogenase family)